MNLKLNLNGSVEPFANYLKSYLRIRESLLLEIDTQKRSFVAKTFTEDKSCVRFSAILFDDANMTVVSDDGEEARAGKRIKVGILIQLKKFIQMVERFGSETDSNGNCNFNIIFNYSELMNDNKDVDFVALETRFESERLKMKMDGFRPSEFNYLSDDVFNNNVFSASDYVSIDVNSNVISSIIKTSEIIKVDPRKDLLVFFVDKKKMFVKDKEKAPNFVYELGEVSQEPNYPISVPIGRDRFITMMDKCSDNFKLIVGLSPERDGMGVNRILFDSITSETKIAIGCTKEK